MPLFDVPGSEITSVIIDEDCVTKNAAPVYKYDKLDPTDTILAEKMGTSVTAEPAVERENEVKNLLVKDGCIVSSGLKSSPSPDTVDK